MFGTEEKKETKHSSSASSSLCDCTKIARAHTSAHRAISAEIIAVGDDGAALGAIPKFARSRRRCITGSLSKCMTYNVLEKDCDIPQGVCEISQ